MNTTPGIPDEQPPASCSDCKELGGVSLESVFRQYQSELLGTLYFLLGNREDAADAVQEAFLRCWKNQDQIPGIDNLKAWIFKIALNIGRDVRKAAWSRKKKDWPEHLDFPSLKECSPATQMEEQEQIQRLRLEIMKLEDEEKDVFLLRQNGELTYQQIAEQLEIPLGTVKTRMRRAIEKIQKML